MTTVLLVCVWIAIVVTSLIFASLMKSIAHNLIKIGGIVQIERDRCLRVIGEHVRTSGNHVSIYQPIIDGIRNGSNPREPMSVTIPVQEGNGFAHVTITAHSQEELNREVEKFLRAKAEENSTAPRKSGSTRLIAHAPGSACSKQGPHMEMNCGRMKEQGTH